MGNYLNPDISTFARVVNSEIYVDKTGLIEYTNRSAKTLQSYICISRPRRFGKSIAANMLSAYYTCEYCLLYTSPSPRDLSTSRMPSSA